jgi:hypothetical protein
MCWPASGFPWPWPHLSRPVVFGLVDGLLTKTSSWLGIVFGLALPLHLPVGEEIESVQSRSLNLNVSFPFSKAHREFKLGIHPCFCPL